jgi:hypothetical protein
VDLAVVVDGGDADDRSAVAVAGEEHCPRAHAFRVLGVGQGGPAQAVVVR